MARALLALALVALLPAAPGAAAQTGKPTPLSIYVGPQTRDGFVDADRGVLDSIKDIQKALRRRPLFRVVERQAEAQAVVVVERRGAGSRDAATVSVPIGNQRWYVPVESYEIVAALRVGAYERALGCVDGTWTGCARKLVRDVEAWVTANRDRLTDIGRPSEQKTNNASPTCTEWLTAYFGKDPSSEGRRLSEEVIDNLEQLVADRLETARGSERFKRDQLANRLVSHCFARFLQPINAAIAELAMELVPLER